jgi:hypothetical protein
MNEETHAWLTAAERKEEFVRRCDLNNSSATHAELTLARMLMRAAFYGRVQPEGLGPLYLEQAINILRHPDSGLSQGMYDVLNNCGHFPPGI